jgi:signal peptide peptidase SppA
MRSEAIQILREMQATPWAIMPEHLSALTAWVARGMPDETSGQTGKPTNLGVDGDALLEAAVAQLDDEAPQKGRIAVLPLRGLIMQRGGFLLMLFGGTSTQAFTQAFRAVLGDDSVKGIVIDIDSPGGIVYGVQELADEIYQARGRKPIVSVANAEAASAAYWIGSSASEFAVTPSGEVGSIGVWQLHVDMSKALEDMGIKPTYVSAGKYKVEGNPFEPLSDEAKAFFQTQVNSYYDDFVSAVARNRGAGKPAVRNGYGQGRVLVARQALSEKLVDRIATFDDVVAKLQTGRMRTRAGASEPLTPSPSPVDSSSTPPRERGENRIGLREREVRLLTGSGVSELTSEQ